MKINFFCPRWGSEYLSWKEFCVKVKLAGYNGIEYAIASQTTVEELYGVWNECAKNNLLVIAQHYDTYEADFTRHADAYYAWFAKLDKFKLVKINSQTGKDFFTQYQNISLIDIAREYSKKTGVEVVHETHRNKFSFAAHITKTYLEKNAELRLTLDVSHWVNVAESYLEDQPEAVQLAIERADHIHARVGFPEGPQVPDPRMPEWKEALDKHLDWWDRVVAIKKASGETLTVSPEFGPFPYMVNVPATGKPIADQWEINCFMMDLLRKRYDW